MSDELKNVQDLFNDYENQKIIQMERNSKISWKSILHLEIKRNFQNFTSKQGEKIVEKLLHQVPVTTSKKENNGKLYCLSKNGDST